MSEAENHNEDDVLAAEYAMHLLPASERAAFEARLQAEPDLRALVAQWRERLSPLDDQTAPVAPPAQIKKALEGELFGQEASAVPFWERVTLWRWASLTSMAAAIALAAFVVFAPEPSKGPVMVAEVAAADDSLRLLARYDDKQGVLEVSRIRGEAAQGRSLELWLIAGQNDPVSLGVLPTDKRGRITIDARLRPLMDNAVLAISDEPLGGSPTGRSTGPVLAVGQINSV